MSISTHSPSISLTPIAIQKAQDALRRHCNQQGVPTSFLRLGVKGGGCDGFSYVMEIVDSSNIRDIVFEFDNNGEKVKVLVDPKSLILLDGTVLDYETKLMGYGFKFRNPNEKSSCSCGQSFSV